MIAPYAAARAGRDSAHIRHGPAHSASANRYGAVTIAV